MILNCRNYASNLMETNDDKLPPLEEDEKEDKDAYYKDSYSNYSIHLEMLQVIK